MNNPSGSAARRAFRSDQAAEFGFGPHHLRTKRFQSPFHGVHVDGPLPGLVDRCHAATLVLPAGAVFSDATALALMTLPVPRGPDVLHVSVPVGTAQVRRRGIVGHVRDLRAQDVTVRDGLAMTTAACTFVYLAAVLGRRTLIGLGDAILRARLATVPELAEMTDAYSGRRGSGRARQMIPLLNAAAESVMESTLRLLLLDAGLPIPEVNAKVYDAFGQFLARADLLFRAAKVIVEYDGDQHRVSREQFAIDVGRGSELAAAGYLVLRFTASDLFGRPHYIVATVRAALAQRVPS
jgi:very-short-patch-repair endonuclease